MGDLEVRKQWPQYMRAYERALAATLRAAAPWYVIPANDKLHRNLMIAELLVRTLKRWSWRRPKRKPAPRGPAGGIDCDGHRSACRDSSRRHGTTLMKTSITSVDRAVAARSVAPHHAPAKMHALTATRCGCCRSASRNTAAAPSAVLLIAPRAISHHDQANYANVEWVVMPALPADADGDPRRRRYRAILAATGGASFVVKTIDAALMLQ